MSISVAFCFYNNQKTIRRALKSILNQKKVKFEIILVNDGSIDSSEKNIIDLIKKYKKIKYFKNKKNFGLAYCLNFCCRKAKYNLIARMDADDISLSNRFFLQEKFLLQHKEISVLGTNAIYFDEHDKKLKSKMEIFDKSIKQKMFYQNQFIHPSIMFRKSFFKKTGGYNIKISRGQDHDLWLRGASLNFKYHNLDNYLIKVFSPSSFKSLKTYFYLGFIPLKNSIKQGKYFNIIFLLFYLPIIYFYILLKPFVKNNEY